MDKPTSIAREHTPSPLLMFAPLDTKPSLDTHAHPQAQPVAPNQMPMPYIKRHVKRRLTNAKDACDKELRRIVDSITLFVEERLRDASEFELEEPPEQANDILLRHIRSPGLFPADTASNVSDDEAELEINRHSRQSMSLHAIKFHVRLLTLAYHSFLSSIYRIIQSSLLETPSSAQAGRNISVLWIYRRAQSRSSRSIQLSRQSLQRVTALV